VRILVLGSDVVKELIDENYRRYAGPAREFVCLAIARDQLPPADLILCRDCLVHLPFEYRPRPAQFPPHWRLLCTHHNLPQHDGECRPRHEGCVTAAESPGAAA